MASRKILENSIVRSKQRIVDLMNSIADDKYDILLSKFAKTYEKEVNIGTVKKPKMVTAKFGVLYHRVEKDTGKITFVERNIMYELDGFKMFDSTRPVKKYTVENMNHFLENIGGD